MIESNTKIFDFDYITKEDIKKDMIQNGQKFLTIHTEY